MELIQVKSANLSKVGYDEESELLLIVFNSGSIYEFQKVPKDLYESLMQAPSIGSFFNKTIRNRYVYKKIV